jgi:hypothetical protein
MRHLHHHICAALAKCNIHTNIMKQFNIVFSLFVACCTGANEKDAPAAKSRSLLGADSANTADHGGWGGYGGGGHYDIGECFALLYLLCPVLRSASSGAESWLVKHHIICILLRTYVAHVGCSDTKAPVPWGGPISCFTLAQCQSHF